MNPSRRDLLRIGAAGGALAARAPIAWAAQAYPAHPVRILSGFPPGGISDTYARLIAQWLSEHLGQQFIVENRPGAGSTLAAEYVAKAAPDGYTLLLTTSAEAWNETLYNNLNFHVPADFTPVATISRGAGVLVVNPSVPAVSVPQLIAYANGNPGKVTVASAGIGSAPYMFWELFRSATGVDMVHVPCRDSRRASLSALPRRAARPPISSKRSTRRSTSRLRTRQSRGASRNSATRPFCFRHPISPSSSATKPKNGAR